MKLKVLPPESWMLAPHALEDCTSPRHGIFRYTPRDPQFHRPGIYKQGNLCWFESDDRAWSYDPKDFAYSLSLLQAAELNTHQVRALQAVVDQKLATKAQRHLLRMCGDSASIRQSGRNARSWVNRFLRKQPKP